MDRNSTPTFPLVTRVRISGGRKVALEDVIGRGSVATVYAGTVQGPPVGPRRVAVKVFDRLPEDEKDHILMCLSRAVAATACVNDARVLQVYDYDLSRRTPFVVLEYVHGGALETLIDGYARQEKLFPQELAILIGLKIAEGLEAAFGARFPDGHRADLVHGNVSARDVLVSWEGEVKIGDFGLAAATAAVSMMRALDTAAHLAPTPPEVAWGHPADARSDVFSLGILLRHMLVGQRFSPHTSPAEAVQLVRAGAVHVSLAEHALVPPLRTILKRATEPDPRRRFANARELANALRGVAQLLNIPDVPAYIGRAIQVAFEPEITRSHLAACEVEPQASECVAELVDGYEAYANIVEISKAPRVAHPRPRLPPSSAVTKTAPMVKPPPEKAPLAKPTPIVERVAPPANPLPHTPPKREQHAPKASAPSKPSPSASKPAPRVPRPTPRPRTKDSAPTIVSAKPSFDDD